MKIEKNKMNILGEKYAVVILCEAFKAEEDMKISDLLSLITNYRTIEIICSKLEQSGLITLYDDGERHQSRRIKLTEKGKQISTRLIECVDLL